MLIACAKLENSQEEAKKRETTSGARIWIQVCSSRKRKRKRRRGRRRSDELRVVGDELVRCRHL
jgi:hypothetical protein